MLERRLPEGCGPGLWMIHCPRSRHIADELEVMTPLAVGSCEHKFQSLYGAIIITSICYTCTNVLICDYFTIRRTGAGLHRDAY